MDFITENYIWFIVGAIIILMAVIGYYADKTDFGRKEKEEKKPKSKPVKEEIKEEIKVEEVKKEKPKKEKKKKEKKKKEKVESNELVETVETQPQEDLYAPIDTMPQVDTNEMVDEALFAPLTDTLQEITEEVNDEPMLTEENVIEPINDEIESNSDFELQSVEPTVLPEFTMEDNSDTVPEEDVWKF